MNGQYWLLSNYNLVLHVYQADLFIVRPAPQTELINIRKLFILSFNVYSSTNFIV